MAQSDLDRLVDRWTNDPEFRAKMRSDPEATILAEGVALSEDEFAALRSIDWSESDTELGARISKTTPGC